MERKRAQARTEALLQTRLQVRGKSERWVGGGLGGWVGERRTKKERERHASIPWGTHPPTHLPPSLQEIFTLVNGSVDHIPPASYQFEVRRLPSPSFPPPTHPPTLPPPADHLGGLVAAGPGAGPGLQDSKQPRVDQQLVVRWVEREKEEEEEEEEEDVRTVHRCINRKRRKGKQNKKRKGKKENEESL